jgi:hypothetical protein
MLPVTTNVNIQRILADNGIDASLLDRVDAIVPARQGYCRLRSRRCRAIRSSRSCSRVAAALLAPRQRSAAGDSRRRSRRTSSRTMRWPWWPALFGTWGPEFFARILRAAATHGHPPATPGVEGPSTRGFRASRPGARCRRSMRSISTPPRRRTCSASSRLTVDGHVATAFRRVAAGRPARLRRRGGARFGAVLRVADRGERAHRAPEAPVSRGAHRAGVARDACRPAGPTRQVNEIYLASPALLADLWPP